MLSQSRLPPTFVSRIVLFVRERLARAIPVSEARGTHGFTEEGLDHDADLSDPAMKDQEIFRSCKHNQLKCR
jgi:hypothetical protein